MSLTLGGYIRVSSEEQAEGYSVEAQKHAIMQWAALNGYHLDRFFIDVKSGRNDKRPEFRKATRWVINSAADGLVVHKIDRFARNLADLLFYINTIQQADKWLYSVCEPFVNDNSPLSKMLVSIMGALAQYYSDNLSTEVKKGQAQMVRNGIYPGGRLPFGYYRPTPDTILPHPEYGSLVTTAFSVFSKGSHTLKAWREEARRQGAPQSMGIQSWLNIFRNRFYLGEFTWRKSRYKGNHPPLTNETIFKLVQDHLDRGKPDGRDKKMKHFWLLTGFLWSEPEGKRMHGSLVKKRFGYYVANKHSVRADELEKRLATKLEQVQGHSDFLQERYRLAVQATSNIGQVWDCIESPHQKKELLSGVVKPLGVVVSKGGAIVDLKVQDGFDYR